MPALPRERSTAASPILSAQALAAALAVDRGTVVESWVPKGCPVAQEAVREMGIPWGFCLADVVRWLSSGGAAGDGEALDRRVADARRAHAEAALAELELAERNGSLVPIEVVAGELAETLATARSRLLSSATELAQRLPLVADPTERERVARDILGTALEGLVAEAEVEASEMLADEL